MKGYGQFCPVALAAEVFAERWTPLILRELLSGARRFADIHRGCREYPGICFLSASTRLRTVGSLSGNRSHAGEVLNMISPTPAGSSVL